MNPEYLSQTEAAIRLGVSRYTIHRTIRSGRLPHKIIGGRPLILASDLARLKIDPEMQAMGRGESRLKARKKNQA